MTEKNGLFVLYADGACRGNPGPMGARAVLAGAAAGVLTFGVLATLTVKRRGIR